MIPATEAATPATHRAPGTDFADLFRVVQQSGLLRRRYGYYAVRCSLTFAPFALSWVVFGFLGDS